VRARRPPKKKETDKMTRNQRNKKNTNNRDDLIRLGWTPAFETALAALRLEDDPLPPARVSGVRKNHFLVNDGAGERLATLTGRCRHKAVTPADLPVAGDWVLLEGNRIAAVLPRRNILSRGASGERSRRSEGAGTGQPIAANLDTVFVVCGLDRDYNLRRIERYIALIYNCGLSPVVLLNKCDLCADVDDRVAEVEAAAIGVPVHALSATASVGLEVLERYLPEGKTVALLGSSGAGKTTVVNRLQGEGQRATAPVGGYAGKGVHTTTTRDLVLLPGRGMAIDNPGIREIAFWDDGEGAGRTFADVEELAAACRFADCRHGGEPGCAVRIAVEEETLDPGRLASYLKMKRELEWLSERRDKSADRIEKERWKAVALKVKEIKKARR
jgi:ribosome biogenesis GTPase